VEIRLMTNSTRVLRPPLRVSASADGAGWPHVGECAFGGRRRTDRMVEQRKGGRVSAAGDAM
jgi:hypothetical protein